MQEQPCVIPPEKLLQEFFRLSAAAFDIHGAEYRYDVLEQELCVVRSSANSVPVSGACVRYGGVVVVRVQELEHLQFATDPFTGPGNEVFVPAQRLWRDLAILG